MCNKITKEELISRISRCKYDILLVDQIGNITSNMATVHGSNLINKACSESKKDLLEQIEEHGKMLVDIINEEDHGWRGKLIRPFNECIDYMTYCSEEELKSISEYIKSYWDGKI